MPFGIPALAGNVTGDDNLTKLRGSLKEHNGYLVTELIHIKRSPINTVYTEIVEFLGWIYRLGRVREDAKRTET